MVFRPPLDAYDVLIHLVPQQVPLLAKAVDASALSFQQGTFRGEPAASGGALPVIDYNPVQLYLSELRVCVAFNSLFAQSFSIMVCHIFLNTIVINQIHLVPIFLFNFLRMRLEIWLCFSMTHSVEP